MTLDELGQITRGGLASIASGLGRIVATVRHSTTLLLAELADLALSQRQSLDAGNSTVMAPPGAPFVGAWTPTRDEGIVRILTVLASNVASGLGATFVFEFSEDGVTATISESRPITDFATVRDFDLINAGKYYRVRLTLSRALVGGELVFVSTTLRRQNDGQFVRLAGQEIEEGNAAYGATFAYGKAFGLDGKSVNLRASSLSLSNNSEAVLAGAATFTGAAEECLQHQSISVFVAADQAGTLTVEFAKNAADFATATRVAAISRPYTTGAGQGYVFSPIAKFYRVKFLNTGALQTFFRLQTVVHATAVGPIFSPLDTTLTDVALAQQTRAVIAGKTPSGSYLNVPANAQGNLITVDFLSEVAKGNVPKHRLISQLGVNRDVDAAASETVWAFGGAYAYAAAAGLVALVSTSLLDTAAGTGARTVRIEGLDAAYAEVSETVTLNGIVPVNSVLSYLRVNQLIVLTAGALGANQGTIAATIGAVTLMMIDVGTVTIPAPNRGMSAVRTIPAGHKGYLLTVAFVATQNTATATAVGYLRIRALGGTFQTRDRYQAGATGAGSVITYAAPIEIPEKSDVQIDAAASNNNTEVAARMDLLLVQD